MADKTQAAPTIRERVAAGAAWLDKHQPGWLQKLDLITLDLEDPESCVLGQAYGNYDERPADLRPAGVAEWHGFYVALEHHRTTDEVAAEYGRLTDAWREHVLSALPLPAAVERPCCPCQRAVCEPGCRCTSPECPKTDAELTDD